MSGSAHASTPSRTPAHLWIVGILALVWNLGGVFDYLATHMQLDFYMSRFSQEQLDYFYGLPDWAVAGWAFGVWLGLAGAVALLLRRRWAIWCFLISILGMIVSSIYTVGLSEAVKIMGSGTLIFTAVIWAVSIFLLVYSKKMADRGVLV